MNYLRRCKVVVALCAALVAVAAAQSVPLDALMRGGRIHYSGGRFDRAKEQFQKALDQYGATAEPAALSDIYVWLGVSEAQLKAFAAAAEHLVLAFDADSSSMTEVRRDEAMMHWAWTALITATRDNYAGLQNEAALRYAKAALKLDPDKPQTYALVANIYSALERYEEMRRTADDLLKLNAGSPEAYGLLGLYFLQRPDSLWPTKAAKVGRWDSSGYYYDQAIAEYAKRYKAAEADLQKTVQLSDSAKVSEAARQLVVKSRIGDTAVLGAYIREDLKAGGQSFYAVAQIASRLFFAANNLNSASSRAGTAMLRASTETRGDTADRFRDRAEALFEEAFRYDETDFNSLFNLGIAQYQGQKDSLSAASFQRVIEGAVAPASDLPPALQDSLLSWVTPENYSVGHLQIASEAGFAIDSALRAAGRPAPTYPWFYFPDAKAWKPFRPATAADIPGMFLSSELPGQLENVYLLHGVGLTAFAMSLADANRRPALYSAATASLLTVTRINPSSAEAWQNLVHCYRETGQPQRAEEAYKTYKKLSQ